LAELTIKIKGDSKDAQQALKQTDDALENTGKTTKKTSTAMAGGYAAIAAAAVAAGVMIGRAFIDIIKVSSDAEETISKFGVVFSSVGSEAERVAQNLADNFGLSSVKAKELLGNTGDLLTGFGFTGAAALDLSEQVNTLAVDLASFTNFSGGAEGASAALTKALLGERESVKALGISILETDVKAKILELTQKGMTFETNRQAKAYATLLIAQEQSKNAIGDYARTSGSAANQMKLFSQKMIDLKVSIGTALLPIVTKVITAINGIVSATTGAIEKFKDFLNTTAGIRAIAAAVFLVKLGFELATFTLQRMVDFALAGIEIMVNSFSGLGEIIRSVFSGDLKGAVNEFKDTILENQLIIGEAFVGGYKDMGKIISDFYRKWQNADKKNSKKIEKSNTKLTFGIVKTWQETFKEMIISADAWMDKNKKNFDIVKNSFNTISSGLVQIEKNKLAQMDDADADARNKQANRIRRLMVFEKSTKIAGAIIDSAAAVLKTMASVPFPFNIPLAISQAAAGAVQVGVIASQPIPSAADLKAPHGADFTTDGPTTMTVGDNPSGRERVTVTPEEDEAGGGENIFYIDNVTIVTDSPEDFGNQMKELGIRTARRA
jgi:hypothetical protein